MRNKARKKSRSQYGDRTPSDRRKQHPLWKRFGFGFRQILRYKSAKFDFQSRLTSEQNWLKKDAAFFTEGIRFFSSSFGEPNRFERLSLKYVFI